MEIRCVEHGVFWQEYGVHVYHRCGCPICKESHGEHKTSNWLTIHNIDFIREYTYRDLVGVSGWYRLPFDFYIPDIDTLIEYDGRQHFEWISGMVSHDDYLKRLEHDKRKNEYCDKHCIRLIRIRYDEDINEVLTNHLHLE